MAPPFRQQTKPLKWISAPWRIGMKMARLWKKIFFMTLWACSSKLEFCPERNKKKPREGGLSTDQEGQQEDHDMPSTAGGFKNPCDTFHPPRTRRSGCACRSQTILD